MDPMLGMIDPTLGRWWVGLFTFSSGNLPGLGLGLGGIRTAGQGQGSSQSGFSQAGFDL